MGGDVGVRGEVAYVAAGDNLSGDAWSGISADMGTISRRLAGVRIAGLDLSRSWVDPDERTSSASAWLAHLSPHLGRDHHDRAREIVEASRSMLDAPPTLCHGDLGPQNVLIDQGRVTGLLDFEDARIAHPLLDSAWRVWLVRAHTPSASRIGWPRFSEARGLADDDPILTALMVLRLLETADGYRRTEPEKYPSWATRLTTLIDR